ncbi:MAG: SurA N-terminal domain-containing protein [Desulfurivibrionaceae bacterium]|nr:SurA N-terminal domain-containing protein [Desulfurivibrionaceae bacterium]
MLDYLRKKTKSPLLQGLIVIIILVFIFWGTNMGGGDKRDAVATVNGEAVTLSEYSREYSRMIDTLREQFGGTLPENIVESLGIKQQVLQRLIQQTLLIQGAREMGLHASNWEIQEAISQQPYFQVEGTFSHDRYTQILAQNKLTPKQYEAGLRLEILSQKASQGVSGLTTVTDWEINQRFAFNNNQLKVAFASFAASDFRQDVQVTDAQLQAYFQQHQEEYKSAPQVKIKYLAFPVAQAMEELTISDAEIKAYYQQNIATYQKPEKRTARHILLKTDGTNDEAQKAKAEEVLEKIKAGESFSALARAISEDPGSADQGGELGTVSRGQMVPAFEEAVFNLDKKEVSELIKTRFGYHIIEVTDISPAEITPLAEVEESIRRTLKQQQAKNKAFADAGAAYEKIFQAGSIAAYSQQEGITLQSAGFFSQSNPPAELAGKPRLLDQAFNLEEGELSALIEEADGYYILFIDDVLEPAVPELQTVKEELIADFKFAKSRELAQAAATEILAACQEASTFKQAVTEAGARFQTTPWFSRNAPDRSTLPAAISSTALTLSASHPCPATIGTDNSTFYAYRFLEKRTNPSASEADKEEFKASLLQEKQVATLESWLTHMMATSEITTNPKLIE